MICAIVLAAGQSRRMGAQKLLLPYGGKTVIQHIVDQLLDSRLDEVFVVAGNDKEKISQQLAERPVHIMTNPDPQAEMLSSVRCGLQALPQPCQAVLVALAGLSDGTKRPGKATGGPATATRCGSGPTRESTS